ncbi:hypothetical protein [Caballeronia sp. GACF4]|uniref:hypothetical protein n=1 Tax=Caballeronia sp. GACF4 TaxID=2921763 RepID=UPI0020288E05|nr:hypothetical protein [Caballeronia sp. GACF4]
MPNSQQEAAAIHVAILSVAPWHTYASALQPNMNVSIKEAIQMALPVSSQYQRYLLSLLSASVAIQGPTIGRSSTSSSMQSNGASDNAVRTTVDGVLSASDASTASSASAASNTASTTRNSGAVPASTPAFATMTDLPSALAFTGSGLTPSQLLASEIGFSIFQEMQILSRYVGDAAFRNGYEPYIVRAQVSIAPYAHHQPFDTYVQLGLFTKCVNNVSDVENQEAVEVDANPPSPKERKSNARYTALVLPLLVTDQMETQQASNAANIAHQLALSLGGSVGDVGAKGDLQSIKKRLDSLLGIEYNSLYMVSRTIDNVLQVRFGAGYDAVSGYAMTTSTHQVTFVLMTRKHTCPAGQHTQILMSSASKLRNAQTGAALHADRQLLAAQVQEILERFNASQSIDFAAVLHLIGVIQDNDYFKFRQFLIERGVDPSMGEALWTNLADVIGSSEYGYAVADQPSWPQDVTRSRDNRLQNVLLKQSPIVQDSETGATVTLAFDPALRQNMTSAALRFSGANAPTLVAQIQPGPSVGTVVLSFPALSALGASRLVPKAGGPLNATLDIQTEDTYWKQSGQPPLHDFSLKPVIYVPMPKKADPPKAASDQKKTTDKVAKAG